MTCLKLKKNYSEDKIIQCYLSLSRICSFVCTSFCVVTEGITNKKERETFSIYTKMYFLSVNGIFKSDMKTTHNKTVLQQRTSKKKNLYKR